MNMGYYKGQIVGYVPVDVEPIAVPAVPSRWYLWRITPGRDAKVMQAFARMNLSGYSPAIVRTIDRGRGGEVRKSHLGRLVTRAFLPGLLFVPDFEVDQSYLAIRAIDDVDDLLKVGEFIPTMSADEMRKLRLIVAALNVPRARRKFAIGELVRIVDGPMAQFVGKIERLDSKGRLKVFIDAITRGVSVQISETQVEPAV
ncbi:transcription termination/antitermination protein NusG [Bradyrhizobium lablabi]|uniref:transcription termination/antitermination protein NusG n=1 Tax=Bradyrhizobium lablabi TaxID=722472 RepID=UPI001BAD52A8|nr:transcription termination/antitermination NusG family protein [Bradyrhizobium lablabi]MBR0695964.1 ABC transporter substrate-binding protein [Bradyrhizobium lablabi]